MIYHDTDVDTNSDTNIYLFVAGARAGAPKRAMEHPWARKERPWAHQGTPRSAPGRTKERPGAPLGGAFGAPWRAQGCALARLGVKRRRAWAETTPRSAEARSSLHSGVICISLESETTSSLQPIPASSQPKPRVASAHGSAVSAQTPRRFSRRAQPVHCRVTRRPLMVGQEGPGQMAAELAAAGVTLGQVSRRGRDARSS